MLKTFIENSFLNMLKNVFNDHKKVTTLTIVEF